MKNRLFTFSFLLLLLLMGCQSKKDKTPLSQITGKWQLVKVLPTSMIAGQSGTPVAPPYQEIFEFKADSTFRRYRSNGYEATGTYTFKQYSADDYGILATFDDKELSYHEFSGDRLNAYTEGQVYLRQLEPGVLMESYMAADGPSFYYHKVSDKE